MLGERGEEVELREGISESPPVSSRRHKMSYGSTSSSGPVHVEMEGNEDTPLLSNAVLGPPAESGEEEAAASRTAWEQLRALVSREPVLKSRRVPFNPESVQGSGFEQDSYPLNVIRNQKYSAFSFFPVALLMQFKSFINLFYLLVSISQLFDILKVGFLFTYIAPLIFVVAITMAKEGYDDYSRYRRDKEVNSQRYERLTANGFEPLPASDMKVGHFIRIKVNQRVPADMVLLRTTEDSGASFIRTDQLDGETDWKLRRAYAKTQQLERDEDLLRLQGEVFAEKPRKDIYNFIGTVQLSGHAVDSISLENTMWGNTVLASGTVIGLVVYTGRETRSVLNTSQPASKKGTLDREINWLAMMLGVLLVFLSIGMVAGNLFHGLWLVDGLRYIILFSFIVPISMSVNLDMAKLVYVWFMMNDNKIRGTIVRNTGLPEELGRISYLMSDKTGTLTQNDMIFKKLHLGQLSFSPDALDEVAGYLKHDASSSEGKVRRQLPRKVREAITALAVCHNVTPVNEVDEETGEQSRVYQASSPDEIALVKFTETVGVTLTDRTFQEITLTNADGRIEKYEVLNIFPFTSSKKRMGIIVRDLQTNEILFLMKGADVVMQQIVQYSDWLEEECTNLAREGLRTLCFGRKVLSEAEYADFARRYHDAEVSLVDREKRVEEAEISLEENLELIGLSGVEDKLQKNVRTTLEKLRHAGVKIWMLTGDKIETATCVARSAKLVSRSQSIHTMVVKNAREAKEHLDEFAQIQSNTVLVIDGTSLQICLDHWKEEFFQSTKNAPSVACCRCSPTQKAEIVKLIRQFTKKQTAAIGDGGNDVSMIQAADVGIGIEGKEGKQASMAADFSIMQFSFVARLLLWHGRNSYHRSAILSQFIIHRGMLITFVQIVFSAMYYWSSVAMFTGIMLFGYSTFYTSLPIFALVLDEDVSEENAFMYPELYEQLQKGRALSSKTFMLWCFQTAYQAAVVTLSPVFIYQYDITLQHFGAFVFTALVLVELINVAFEMQSWTFLEWRTWRVPMVMSEVITLAISLPSIVIFYGSFDIVFVSLPSFWINVSLVTLACVLPVYFAKLIRRRFNPPAWTKV
eukprot:TRINITY_DN5047_c0_g1_i1.p1 TRINITY_DN5047_c0_g1~~TRINITY_DN5047_c0_g1_i1.p1  ORF type:complete len:1089 (+),score=461.23 TRINITY_DN5047_c0_g1_i1:91-3357(+)